MAQPEHESKLKVGISIGDANGISMEVIIKTFLDPNMLQVCTPIIYGSSKVLSFHRKALNIPEFNYTTIRYMQELNPKKVNLVNCWEEDIKIEIGHPSAVGGRYAIKSLDAACKDLMEKKIDVMVTAPLDKNSVQAELPGFTGHTGYLAQKFNAPEHLMILTSEFLNVAFVTGHVPLSNVASQLTSEKIYAAIAAMNQSLKRDFNIRKPKIAVLGLNPHAGDGGVIGNEEEQVIKPAVKKAFDEGIMAMGPFAADGFFGAGSFKKYDGVMGMYHDQGLIPFKLLAFSNGVNFTSGLPHIRTSPDHGTGYDIAGKNIADEGSFRQAIYTACDIFNNRKEYDSINANPLKHAKLGSDR